MFTLVVAIALSASLLVQWAALRVGVRDPTVQSQADVCIPQLQAANAAFKAAAAVDTSHGQDPNKHSLLLTDPNVANTLRCQQALVQLVGVPPAAPDSEAAAAPGDSDPVFDNAQQSAGGNQPTNCSFTSGFRDGTVGSVYSQSFRAKNPFGGAAKASVTMANPSTGTCGGGGGSSLDQRDGGWSGSCFVSAENTRGLTGQATVTLTTTAPFFLPPTDPVTGGCPQGTTRGTLDSNGTFNADPNGNKCVLIPIGSLNGNCTLSGAVPDFYKGVISFDSQAGYCLLSCSSSASFAWKSPPVKCVNFSALPNAVDKGSTQPVFLNALVGNAKSVTIDQGIGGVAPLDPSNSGQKIGPLAIPVLPDPPGTTYTLIATGAGGDTCTMTASLVVRDNTPPTVTLTSPAANDVILDTGVTVSGVVTPVPDAAHRTAQILVNGAFLSEATINASGQFSGRTALQNTIALSDIDVVGDPAIGLNRCGAVAAPIGVAANPFPNAKNLIRVVVPLASGSVSASVQVEHAISVNSFQVSWGGGCGPAPSQNQSPGIIVRGNQPAVSVGSVNCGFFGPTHCSDVATIRVGTSVGTKVVTESWTVNIDSCN